MREKSVSFEKSIERLDAIVRSLEQGNVPLEQALKLFQEGTGLVKTCDEMLTKYSEERLLGSSEDGFDENISKLFQSVKAALEQAEQAQDAEPNDTEE